MNDSKNKSNIIKAIEEAEKEASNPAGVHYGCFLPDLTEFAIFAV